MPDISSRKTDHLDLAIGGNVGFKHKTTLLECVQLAHCSLPELALDQVELGCERFGRTLQAPLLIAAMTGGTERAGKINRSLAAVAERCGVGFGLGSQRPMLTGKGSIKTFQVRDVAPTTLVLGNLGVVQATQLETGAIATLVGSVGADALCVHLNPAMELIQAEGDRDFRGAEQTLSRLNAELSVPVIAKETGSGISRPVATRLAQIGLQHLDVSGAGGTSWVAVEAERAQGSQRRLGELLWDWGIPTAASLLATQGLGLKTVIATGGIQDGLAAARALALGADLVGIARPVLQALEAGGEQGAEEFVRQVQGEIRSVMLLVGARTLKQLKSCPRVLCGDLRDWRELWQQA